MDINSLSYFKAHWAVWKFLGIGSNYVIWRPLLIIYIVMSQSLFSFAYSLHLALSIFNNETLTDDIKNLTTFAVCFAGTLKSVLVPFNFYKIHQMESLVKLLDSRVSGKDEINIYIQFKTQLRNILYGFIAIYVTVGVSAELSFVFQGKRGLMYPAYFPFDWKNSTRNYYLTHIYQIVGISFLLIENWTFDCYPAMILCVISAHTKMLHKRFEKVGVNNPGDAEAQSQLEACITDHKCLLELVENSYFLCLNILIDSLTFRLFKTTESLISIPMLIQFTVAAMNICISIAGFLFFVTEPMGRMYFLFYSIGVPMQIFPTCYYGTDTELWFGKIHYAAFSCDWTSQSKSFKKKLMLFVECSLKQNTPMAGGMLRIHVSTFFSTVKFAYSLFTILLRMRN